MFQISGTKLLKFEFVFMLISYFHQNQKKYPAKLKERIIYEHYPEIKRKCKTEES